jgi:FixJ family two-component response regulator
MQFIILDDDREVLSLLSDVLCHAMPDAQVITHLDHRSFLDDPCLMTADLYIIDIILNELDGRAIYQMLPPECRAVPTLYISGLGDQVAGGSTSFRMLIQKQPYIDFIQKPISIELLKNRVRLLLRASGRMVDDRRSDAWRRMIEQDRARINAYRQASNLKPLGELISVLNLEVDNG